MWKLPSANIMTYLFFGVVVVLLGEVAVVNTLRFFDIIPGTLRNV